MNIETELQRELEKNRTEAMNNDAETERVKIQFAEKVVRITDIGSHNYGIEVKREVSKKERFNNFISNLKRVLGWS